MYKRYCNYQVCRFKGCTNPAMLAGNYCYEHFDIPNRDR